MIFLKNIKHILTVLAIMVTGVTFNSCSNDVDHNSLNPPVINVAVMEIGYDNSHVGYPGTDLHLDVEVEAEGRISTIAIEMHKEDGSDEEYEYIWTEFEGLLNVDFHQHYEIPATATTGEYYFHFVVTDMEGQQTFYEADFEIQALNDIEAPAIDITSAPTTNQVFTIGETITISGELTDNVALAGRLIALVSVDDNIADADVTGDNIFVIVMQHSQDFGLDPDEYSFTASIEVGATYDNNITPAPIQGYNAWESGDYYILVRTVDGSGNWAFSQHYPITINI